jgi:hypothetical protein
MGLSATIVGCGGETPAPPPANTNTSTELGAPADLTAPDSLNSGSTNGAEGGDLGIPADGGTESSGTESGSTEAGTTERSEGPALPETSP